jgi:glyoxylase-like metal-dependent hydrolase (beta-lactamase superfamily II)
VSDGDRVGPLRVLATPGHTPGHVCLVVEDTGDVFVGDCVGTFGADLQPAPAVFTADSAEADRSLRKLADLGGRRMYFSHGAEIENPWAALSALIGK